jgi:FtsH-binding integral membrane protein
MRATEVAGGDHAQLPVQGQQAWLDRHARAWSEAGLISAVQADSIVAFESAADPTPEPRMTLVAELATYLGAVIAVAGGAAIVGPNWSGLRLGGQLAVGLAIAVVGFVAGTWLARLGDAGSQRVAEFLWTAGTGGTALIAGIVVHAFEPDEGAWYPSAIGVVVLAIGLTLWRGRERPLQLATSGVGAVCLGIGIAMFVDASAWIAAPIVWALAAAFGALAAQGRVRPRLLALVMASIGMMAGSFVLAQESERIASIAATATAVGLVAFAMRDRSIPLLALAMGQFFVATTSLMQTTLHGTAARAIAMVLGLVVVGWVALRAQRIGASPRPARGGAAPDRLLR